MKNMIFVGGIHGVGKSFFCDIICKKYNLISYSASKLISSRKKNLFSFDKKVKNISENQDVLLSALELLDLGESWYLLDGHFCLINSQGEVNKIPKRTFEQLSPRGIIVITEDVAKIQTRLSKRNIYYDYQFVELFQKKEISFSKEISKELNVPYLNINALENQIDSINKFIINLINNDK